MENDDIKASVLKAIKVFEQSPEFQLILESQANFIPDTTEEVEYKKAIDWIIAKRRRQMIIAFVAITIAAEGDPAIANSIIETADELYEEWFEPKKRARLKLVK